MAPQTKKQRSEAAMQAGRPRRRQRAQSRLRQSRPPERGVSRQAISAESKIELLPMAEVLDE